jgi:hypothetical protein
VAKKVAKGTITDVTFGTLTTGKLGVSRSENWARITLDTGDQFRVTARSGKRLKAGDKVRITQDKGDMTIDIIPVWA